MAVLGGAVVGAAPGLLFALASGSATQSKLKHTATSYSNDTQDCDESKLRHLKNKSPGMMHETLGAKEQNSDIIDTRRHLMDRTKDLFDMGREADE
jgi:gas vesicle protein